MKKMVCLLVAVLLTMSFTVVSAGSYDDVMKSATFSDLVVFKNADIGTYEMRGFTVSPDGKFAYCGLLQNTRSLKKYDIAAGKIVASYVNDDNGYPKGISCDDRGYIYVGEVASAGKDLYANIVVLDTEFKEIADVKITREAVFGINGVSVTKRDGKYYVYVVLNYGPNAIECYDVTDPKAPVMNSSFADNGVLDFKKLIGTESAEANYLDIDSDGTIYVGAKVDGTGSKGDHLVKISADGKSVISKCALSEAYGVELFEDYVLVSTYNKTNSVVKVLNKSDLSEVTELAKDSQSSNYSGVVVINNTIYVSDQGFGGEGDRIIKSNVLDIVKETDDNITDEEDDGTKESPVTGESGVAVLAVLAVLSCCVIIGKKKKIN